MSQQRFPNRPDQVTRVLVIGSSRLMGEALARLLTGPDGSIEAWSAEPGAILGDHGPSEPQVAVLEVADLDTVATTAAWVRALWPEVRIVLVVRDDGPASRQVAARVNAGVCVSSHLRPAELLGAVTGPVKAGRREARQRRPPRPERPPSDVQRALSRLTPREREVLGLLVAGLPADVMAITLGVSSNTLRSHLQGVLSKLGVHSRLEAAAVAHRAGIGGDRPRAPANGSAVAAEDALVPGRTE